MAECITLTLKEAVTDTSIAREKEFVAPMVGGVNKSTLKLGLYQYTEVSFADGIGQIYVNGVSQGSKYTAMRNDYVTLELELPSNIKDNLSIYPMVGVYSLGIPLNGNLLNGNNAPRFLKPLNLEVLAKFTSATHYILNYQSVYGKLSDLARANVKYIELENSGSELDLIIDLQNLSNATGLTTLRFGSSSQYVAYEGDFSNIPRTVTDFRIVNNKVFAGDINDLPNVLTYFVYAPRTGLVYSSGTDKKFTSSVGRFESAFNILSPTQIDNLLISLSKSNWVKSAFLYLRGNRTTASDNAIAEITNKGVSVTIYEA